MRRDSRAAACEPQLDADRRIPGDRRRDPCADDELIVAPIDLERTDRTAAVALEEITDKTLQVIP